LKTESTISALRRFANLLNFARIIGQIQNLKHKAQTVLRGYTDRENSSDELKNKLLICLAFHYAQNRTKYLIQCLENYSQYKNYNVTIIIDTNSSESRTAILNLGCFAKSIDVVVHNELDHPYLLTWMHRRHFKKNINEYDYFMYAEDDIIVKEESFSQYIENFNLVWPRYVPSFIRVEELDGVKYNVDSIEVEVATKNNIIRVDGKTFLSLKYPYHAFWIMPKNPLKKSLNKAFTIPKYHDNKYTFCREFAASYPMWQLFKKPIVMLDSRYQIDERCFSFHISNNYSSDPSTLHGKIQVDQLISFATDLVFKSPTKD
jgi:hypothetical protein